MDMLRTFGDPEIWRPGIRLAPGELMGKEEAHARGLLHRSVHLLLLDGTSVLCRKRGDHEVRYAGLWTTTIEAHVLGDATYEQALAPLIPLPLKTQRFGEFRVRDAFENEVCMLYVADVGSDQLSAEFLTGRSMLPEETLRMLSQADALTPHLREAYRLLHLA